MQITKDIRDQNKRRTKSVVLSIRISDIAHRRLEEEAQFNGITVNTLISSVINKHTQWDKLAADVGFASVTKDFLREILKQVADEDIGRIAEETSKSITNAMIYADGKLDINSFFNTMDLWLRSANIPFRHLETEGQLGYIIQHGIGEKWSLYFLRTINSVLINIGYVATHQHYDNNNLTFTVNKPV